MTSSLCDLSLLAFCSSRLSSGTLHNALLRLHLQRPPTAICTHYFAVAALTIADTPRYSSSSTTSFSYTPSLPSPQHDHPSRTILLLFVLLSACRCCQPICLLLLALFLLLLLLLLTYKLQKIVVATRATKLLHFCHLQRQAIQRSSGTSFLDFLPFFVLPSVWPSPTSVAFMPSQSLCHAASSFSSALSTLTAMQLCSSEALLEQFSSNFISLAESSSAPSFLLPHWPRNV